jgi:hypothetical protein
MLRLPKIAFSLLFVAGFVAIGTTAYAQEQPAAEGVEPLSAPCALTFTSGAGQKFIRYCVSTHGNMLQFQSPAGSEHLLIGTLLEGYAVCSTAGVHGFDSGGFGESAWGAVSSSLLTSKGVTITRITADGRIRLTMKFLMDINEKDVLVQVTIENISALALANVQYSRYADIDAANSTLNNFDSTNDSVWGVRDGAFNGLTLNTTNPEIPHVTGIVDIFSAASTQTCGVPAIAGPTTGDLGAKITYSVGNINPGAKKIVKFTYSRQ